MPRVTVLGAGLVGSLIARTLAADGWDVLVCDRSEDALGALAELPRVATARLDFASGAAIAAAVAPADVVVGAVPGFLGHAMLKTVIEARKPVADISFAPEDPLALDALAKERGVPAIVDCGVSPGLSNLACGRAAAWFDTDTLESIVISVGGLPLTRTQPWEYRIVFSATDVIEEYTRPARLSRTERSSRGPPSGRRVRFRAAEPRQDMAQDSSRTASARCLDREGALEPARETLRPGRVMPREGDVSSARRGFFGDVPVEAGGVRYLRGRGSALFPMWRERPRSEGSRAP